MTIQEILRKTYIKYKLSPLDAEILLSLAIKKSREYILAHPEKELTKSQLLKFASFVKRRISGEPIAYITGKKEFFGLEFLVNKNTLVPRAESELLVEEAIRKVETHCARLARDGGAFNATLHENINLAIIDVGTGSGNIIISIAKNIPDKIKNKINFLAVDTSNGALKVARANARKHKLEKKINFIHSDLLNYFLKNKIDQKNTIILANLPYVSQDIYNININNLKYEPKQALISRNNGLAHYIKLLGQIRSLNNDHCSMIIEISPEQRREMSRIIKEMLPKSKTKFFKDLAGRWRAAEISIAS